MSASLPLFDRIFEPGTSDRSVNVGSVLRDEGMKAVLERTAAEFKQKLIGRVEGFPTGYRFTMDRVVDEIGGRPAGVHQNSIGALTFSLAKRGLMKRTGVMKKAERASLHRTDMPEWERL